MTITRQQFIDEVYTALEARPETFTDENLAYAVERAEALFGPDLRTKGGIEKWLEKQPNACLVQVVETDHYIVLVSRTMPYNLLSDMREQGLECEEMASTSWDGPDLEITVAWKGTK